MGKKGVIPDAWEDDDWEVQADKLAEQPEPEPEPPRRMTASERRALHAETNRKIWESAESPEAFHFVEATNSVPLASTFKPQVKVLSRRPPPASTQTIARRRDPVSGAPSQLYDGDGSEDDEENERKKERTLSPEEIRAKQQREREEKQRRYDEVRAKIFGEPNPSSGASSPGAVTPPRPESRGGGYNQRGARGRGRGRGGGNGGGPGRQGQYHNQQFQDEQTRRPDGRSETKELYDPNHSPKPGFQLQKRGGVGNSGGSSSTTPSGRASLMEQDQAGTVIRAPHGPDGSGRVGFGFARRGASRD
ncbi:hypothetical protein SODALDRAFT_361149 [Sodiomyces alkalinus F11]|uniref:Uncharacterized protein n=1 Tax=Sodiomyces alkalinus (strain CBS 110278 / VKM F-3762 / F11) TaxID=1314773 RepID=A0A3N2PSH7_SODAK|nr:hypothetical protein SODALDRAFT_361149 [Sodiomyces alkalinus F11]ROT37440.1 hypothetical protein SODALDRAFT_361149 [Sodiomyces alkalinus F11]